MCEAVLISQNDCSGVDPGHGVIRFSWVCPLTQARTFGNRCSRYTSREPRIRGSAGAAGSGTTLSMLPLVWWLNRTNQVSLRACDTGLPAVS